MQKKETFERFTKIWAGLFNWVGVVALLGLVFVTLADVLGSNVFARPITGSVDISGLLQLCLVAFALAQTQVFKRHVSVDFVILRLPERGQKILRLGSCFVSLLLFGMVICAMILYGITILISRFSSPTLAIPFFPFAFVVAFGCMLLFSVLLGEFFELLMEFKKK
jgi:TRAP-type C4-dicarboxylate transport system permease small subunit